MIPISTAAAMLGLDPPTVRIRAITGRIPGAVRAPIRSGRYSWLVPRAEVEQILREEREERERLARGGWLNAVDASRLLAMVPTSVARLAHDGVLAGSVKGEDGRWIVRRSEVDRVLAEREAAFERREAKREAFRFNPRTGRRDGNKEFP